ncbi:MAG: diiron oxygenase [Candidatus Sericytochromatia bacterium]|nr:diiron oxygenase [Candidatus Sericytochromatia bacterium]
MGHPAPLDLADLGLDRGGLLLLKRALAGLPVGATLAVTGASPELPIHLRAWCRQAGHGFEPAAEVAGVVRVGAAAAGRWQGAEQAGGPDPRVEGALAARPPARWGVAARGAVVEAGGPSFSFGLDDLDQVWSDDAGRLYAQAAASQWDPATAIPWEAPFELPDEVEDALVQVLTYLIENENAALLVPARFLGRLHPHFREVMQLLAVQVADEARHVEVFTRRATRRRQCLGLSTVGGQASLQTLFEEPDFALASFLLSVMGEGTFLSLLAFLEAHAPDPVTRAIMRLAAQDEARHVAFGMAHLQRHLRHDPTLAARLAASVRRRHDALAGTAGLNDEVFDALVVLAAGAWTPAAIARGHAAVLMLQAEMEAGRRGRMLKLGFAADVAAELAGLHTRNFM